MIPRHKPPAAGEWPSLTRDLLGTVREQLRNHSAGVLLCGPAGVGKSRLAAEVAASTSMPTLTLTCKPGGAGVPLSAIHHLIDRQGEDLPQSTRTVEGQLLDRLEHLLGGDTALVVVDDVQWMDAASAEQVALLMRSGRAQLLATARSTRDLAWDMARLIHDDLLRLVDVPAFDRLEIMQLLELALDGPVSHDLAQDLERLTGGNALFLREAVRAAQLAGDLRAEYGVWRSAGWSLPTGSRISDLVDAELDRVDPVHRDTLEMVALSEPVDLADILAASSEGATAVEALLDAGLIDVHDRGGARRVVEMQHPVYAERIRRRIPLSRRSRLHDLRYADVAVRELPPADFLRWINDALDCGKTVEPEDLVRAARSATGLGQDQFALRMADSACIQIHPGSQPLMWADARILRASQLLLVGDWGRALADLDDAVGILEECDRPIDEVAPLLPAADRARADAQQFSLDDLDAALDTVARAASRDLPPEWSVDLEVAQARRRAWGGDYTTLLGLVHRLEEEELSYDLIELVGPAMLALTWRGEVDRALAIGLRAWPAAEKAAEVLPMATLEIFSGIFFSLTTAGRIKELEQGQDLDPSTLRRHDTATVRAARARMNAVRGEWQEAWHGYEAALQISAAHDPAGLGDWLACMAADAAAMAGASDSATRLVEQHAGFHSTSRGMAAEGRTHLTRAAVALGRDDAADRAIELDLWAAEQGFDLVRLDALHLLGLADPARLRTHLAAHGPAPDASPSAPATALLLTHIEATAADDMRLAQVSSAGLAVAGRWAPSPRRVTRLSPREREIASLVAAGFTSPDIAERLGLSTRTIESHLGRIFTKLDIRRRADVATALARHDQ